jgi:hypothetical protein
MTPEQIEEAQKLAREWKPLRRRVGGDTNPKGDLATRTSSRGGLFLIGNLRR